jgi:predicted TIM-barrel fold metal-dependent hydrolase
MNDRVPIIDAHHHFIPAKIFEDLESYLPPEMTVERDEKMVRVSSDGTLKLRAEREPYSSAAYQLRDMDAAGVQTSILSASVYQEWMSVRASKVFNLEMAELQQKHGDRFVGLAHVPPFGEAGALEELERAIREYGLKGVCITTSFKDKYPDDPAYWDFYRKVNELDVPIFVHAAGCPVCMPTLEPYELSTTIGRPLDHTLATTRILYGGVLDEFKNLRFLMGHLGGAFYILLRRLIPDPNGARQLPAVPKRDYAEQLRRIWFDTAPSFFQSPAQIRCAIETLGLDRIVFGSDYPAGTKAGIVMPEGIDHIHKLGLSAAEKNALLYGTARELFRL